MKIFRIFYLFLENIAGYTMASRPIVLDENVGHFGRVCCSITDENTVLLLYLIKVMVKKQMEVVIYV